MTSTVKSTAASKGWETRRANAAKKAEAAVVTATPVVAVAVETPKPVVSAPVAATAPKKAKTVRKGLTMCGCPDVNCVTMVTRNFQQGHDSRLKARGKAILNGTASIKDLPAKSITETMVAEFWAKNFPTIAKQISVYKMIGMAATA